jgi:3-deoxy-D-manno-octulosonic-acid transferase
LRIVYTISLLLYSLAIHIASLFNGKAKLWLSGRKNIFIKLQLAFENRANETIWFHCASLGEFEQGRPLIEKYKSLYPKTKILLTFFSPSGYEIRKSYAGADYVFYLPLDTPGNAKRFIEIVKPKAAFFVKYEFWFNYLNELKGSNIPTYLVSGVFREDHYFFKSTGGWFRKQLSSFTYFFLQSEASRELLHSIGYTNALVSGDTRFDRVLEISKNVRAFDLVKKFIADGKIIVAGSTWKEDEKLISDSGILASGYKIIIAPHEIDEAHIQSIEAQFSACQRYSNANEANIKTARVLIIDNIGMLSSLYQYGSIAFIGGGFGKGIHNILEAAAFGMPVIFGPNYQKFAEAKELITLGGAFPVKDAAELEKTMMLLKDGQVLRTAAQISKMYVQGKAGATEKILKFIS